MFCFMYFQELASLAHQFQLLYGCLAVLALDNIYQDLSNSFPLPANGKVNGDAMVVCHCYTCCC
jgi:hypothetical protein